MNGITSSAAQTLPTEWHADRDEPFFRLVADLFPTRFTFGASVLLASYDDEAVDTLTPSRTADDPRRNTAGRPNTGLLHANPRRY